MAEVRPTLSEITARMQSDASAALPGVDVALERAMVSVLLNVYAGATFEAYGHLQRIARDGIPDTAEDDALERWAALRDVFRVQGVKASGLGLLTSDLNWTPVQAGARLVRADGVEYEIVDAPFLAAGSWFADIRAIEPGENGNHGPSGTLRLVEPSAGVGDVLVTLIGGIDREDDDNLRERMLDIMRAPPQGGTKADFERWAKSIAGVTRAWPKDPVAGSPAFTIYVADDAKLLEAPPVAPTVDAGDVIAAQSVVDAMKVITALPTVASAAFDPIDPAVTLSPSTAEVHAAVTAELNAMLDAAAGPGVTITLSAIMAAIAGTPGVVNFTLTNPVADVAPAGDNVVWLGTPVYS